MAWIYDVFINFRGGDTRKNFVSHLYAALANAGVNTFLDDEKLQKGKQLGRELLRAIQGSQIALVVFSKTYTSSTWCLEELGKIIESSITYGQVVMPIFYDVDPSEVRHQKGAFGEALKALAERRLSGQGIREYKLSAWKSALTTATNLSGWDVRSSRNEAELINEIVQDILIKLGNTFLSITRFPVGLESRVKEVIEVIKNQSNKVCIVGIWGMGGSGKTTVAKAIYNKIHRNFENRSFIEDIREVCEKDGRGHIRLQEQLVSDILKTKVKKIPSIASGSTMIEKRFCGKKALIVFDDVSKFEQLNALSGNRKWIGSGSVLIITTRDAHILNSLKVDHMVHICRMNEMGEDESLELFSWHAFRAACPQKDYNELSRNVVAYCGGLPLALEVLGSYLCERTKQEWESVLSKLKEIPNDQVQEKLKISYDGLDDMEKNIFLDICCFFIGKNRAYVTEILEACKFHPKIGITILIERSLLKIEKKNKLGMHDLLRDMGREIVRQSSPKKLEKRSRLWNHENVLDVLNEHTGKKAVEGLALKSQTTSRLSFNTKAFEKMIKMRLLLLDHVELIGDYKCLPKKLRWVYWRRFPSEHVPNNFHQKKVVVIDLKCSNIKLVWKEPQLLKKLKILNLSHSKYLTQTPDFTKLPNLKELILKDCPRLVEIHESIGDLSDILVINLKDCKRLGNLPMKIYQLESVKTLILSGCSKIEKLEEDIVQMESLTTLIARDTAIKDVPRSIVRSKSIGYISLCGYEGLSRDIFPSLIRSWISPTMNPLSYVHSFSGISSSLAFMHVQNNNVGDLAPLLSSLSKLRSVWVQCSSEVQLSQELRRILDHLHDVNFTESETTSQASQVSDVSLRSLLIRMGSYHNVINIFAESISQGLTTMGSANLFLSSDNYPNWFTYTGDGHSVHFEVPKVSDCGLKGMILCAIYSSTLKNATAECYISVLIVNYTKFTIHIYKHDTAISFNDEDWQSIISNLGPGDKVEIFVACGPRFSIRKTTVYLLYDKTVEETNLSSPKLKKLRL